MRKQLWSVAAAAALLAVALPALVGPSARAADTRVVAGSSSEQLKFLPADITVPVGTTVIWTNESDVPHDVSADDGSFDSKGTFDKGKEYRFTFSKAGTFPYFCTPHKDAGMKGTVTVSGGSSTPTTAATTATTAPAAPGASTTTATTRPGASSTTATTSVAQAGGSTTTTTAGSGVTSTTQAASTTPTSAPESGDVTSTSAGEDSHGEEEEAAADSHGGSDSGKDTNPIAVGLCAVLTVILATISIKLLTAKG